MNYRWMKTFPELNKKLRLPCSLKAASPKVTLQIIPDLKINVKGNIRECVCSNKLMYNKHTEDII